MSRESEQKNKCNSENASLRLGSLRRESKGLRIDQNQVFDSNCTRRDIHSESRSFKRRADRLGGILRQLEEIKHAHVSYIEAHEGRLRQRLAEDEFEKKQVIQKIDRLKDEITRQLELDPVELEA